MCVNGTAVSSVFKADYTQAGRSSITAFGRNLLTSVQVGSCCGNWFRKTPIARRSTVMVDRPPEKPLFMFGVIADIQYADLDDGYNFQRTSRRYYRSSIDLLRNAVDGWSKAAVKPGFILQLGDLIDGQNKPNGASDRALDAVLKELCAGSIDAHHVWGNHEFYNFSRDWLWRSKLNSSPPGGQTGAGGQVYAYLFRPYPGFTFIILDAYDLALMAREESSQEHREALTLLRQYNKNDDLNSPPGAGLLKRFVMFNGGFSKKQLNWLDSVLTSTDEKHEKVTIACHLPVHPKSTDPICLLWNFDEVLDIIRSHSSVVCFMAGHDHDGGYHLDEDTGVHHVTFEGVIETPPDSNAFGLVSVYDDRMELKGWGRVADRVLYFHQRSRSQDWKNDNLQSEKYVVNEARCKIMYLPSE